MVQLAQETYVPIRLIGDSSLFEKYRGNIPRLFPFTVLATSDAIVLRRLPGYPEGGVDRYIDQMKDYASRHKAWRDAAKKRDASPDSLEAQRDVVRTLVELGDHVRALPELDTLDRKLAALQNPDEAQKKLGIEALELRFEATLQAYRPEQKKALDRLCEKAKQLDPDGQKGLLDDVMVAQAYADLWAAKRKEARDKVEEFRKKYPDSNQLHRAFYILAYYYMSKGDWKNVRAMASEVTKYPKSVHVDWANDMLVRTRDVR